MIFYRMHRVRTITKTVRYRRWEPKPRTRIWNQYNRSDSDKKYYYELIYPNWDRGERWLNHFIHQFLNHAHWMILSILLILSTIMFYNIFFLFYILYCCDPMCAPLHSVYSSVFSQLVRCCMKRSTWAFDRGLCPPVVICLIPRYRFMLCTTPPTNSCASSLTNIKGTPLWKIIPESSAFATPFIFLSGRNQRETSLVHRSIATNISPWVWP